MLIVPAAGVVFLENPKTATQSVRAMLRRDAVVETPRHAAHHLYAAAAADISLRFGTEFETVAVVRHPLERTRSWHRYRQRPQVDGLPHSSAGLSFGAFLREVMEPKPPAFARIGWQDRFVAWDGTQACVDHVFDYARLDLLVDFLSARLGRRLRLPHRNASPAATDDTDLHDDVVAAFEDQRAGEYALYRAVAAAGVLVRRS